MKYFSFAFFSIALLFIFSFSTFAQETETKVVDEVVAQVNDSVITLSGVKREVKEIVAQLVKDGKTQEQAQAEVDSKMGELIANLINEELLLQKGKEIGVDQEVDAEINQRFLQMMQQNNMRSLDKLFEAMRAENVDPDQIRELWRKQITKDTVMQRDVDYKIYWGWSAKELKEYYEKNKAKFTKPETVTISEIFLSFAGRSEVSVREKAKKIVEQIRAGGDFEKIAIENSERQDVQKNKGKVGVLKVAELTPNFAVPLKSLKIGEITDPIEVTEGIEILRLDERSAASNDSVFDENEVRKVMTYEVLPAERKKYLATLRDDSYIKINETYRPIVSPILFSEERKTEKTQK
ncbi:peptidylprolyl isomerase [soil metagenome]